MNVLEKGCWYFHLSSLDSNPRVVIPQNREIECSLESRICTYFKRENLVWGHRVDALKVIGQALSSAILLCERSERSASSALAFANISAIS